MTIQMKKQVRNVPHIVVLASPKVEWHVLHVNMPRKLKSRHLQRVHILSETRYNMVNVKVLMVLLYHQIKLYRKIVMKIAKIVISMLLLALNATKIKIRY